MKKVISTGLMIMFLAASSALASEKGSMKGTAMQDHEAKISKPKAQAAIMGYVAKKSGKAGEYNLDGTKTMFGYLHKGLKPKEDLHVSCVDFTAGNDVYDVDYYVEKKGNHYRVVKEVLHKKNGEKVNKVLWQKENKGSAKK